jgi:putative FmdB family regulatory protein
VPIYEYRCEQCGAVSDVRHGYGETATEPCANCGGRLVRVFSAAPVVFKGSGFYKTDSRKPAAEAKTPAKSAGGDAASASESATTAEPAKGAEAVKASESTKSESPKGAGEAA